MADDELTPSTDEPSDDQPDKHWEAEATKWGVTGYGSGEASTEAQSGFLAMRFSREAV